MLEEFQEADDGTSPGQGFGHKKASGAQACRCWQSSATSKPIDMPARAKVRHASVLHSGRDEEADHEDEGAGGVDGGKMLPPHELASTGSRNGEKVACSVCFGNGRTLKGRDLKCFRNSVLRMTGFLES